MRRGEEFVFAIGHFFEVHDVGHGVAGIHGGIYEVASHFGEQDVLLNDVLHVGQNAQVEIHGVGPRKALGIAVHFGCEHILAGGGGDAKPEQTDEETED